MEYQHFCIGTRSCEAASVTTAPGLNFDDAPTTTLSGGGHPPRENQRVHKRTSIQSGGSDVENRPLINHDKNKNIRAGSYASRSASGKRQPPIVGKAQFHQVSDYQLQEITDFLYEEEDNAGESTIEGDQVFSPEEQFIAGYSSEEAFAGSHLSSPQTPQEKADLYWIKQLCKLNFFFLVAEFIWAHWMSSSGLHLDIYPNSITCALCLWNSIFEFIKQKKRPMATTIDWIGSIPSLVYVVVRSVTNVIHSRDNLSQNNVHQFKIDGLAMFTFVAIYSLSNLQTLRAFYYSDGKSDDSLISVFFPAAKYAASQNSGVLSGVPKEAREYESRVIISLTWLMTIADVTGYFFHCVLWVCLIFGMLQVQWIGHYVVASHSASVMFFLLLLLSYEISSHFPTYAGFFLIPVRFYNVIRSLCPKREQTRNDMFCNRDWSF